MAWRIRKDSKIDGCVLHIPKTAGIWVIEALQLIGFDVLPIASPGAHVRHATWQQLNDERANIAKHRTFTFVRDPVAWWKSCWRFVNTEAGNPACIDPRVWHPFHCCDLKPGLAFPDFVDRAYSSQPAYFSRMCEWYVGPPGWQCVAHVGRQETVAEDLIRIMHQIGLPMLKHQRKSVRRFSRIAVNATTPVAIDCPDWCVELIETQEKPMTERWYPRGNG